MQLVQFVIFEQEEHKGFIQNEHSIPFQKKSGKQAQVLSLVKVEFRIHEVQFVLPEHVMHIGIVHKEH